MPAKIAAGFENYDDHDITDLDQTGEPSIAASSWLTTPGRSATSTSLFSSTPNHQKMSQSGEGQSPANSASTPSSPKTAQVGGPESGEEIPNIYLQSLANLLQGMFILLYGLLSFIYGQVIRLARYIVHSFSAWVKKKIMEGLIYYCFLYGFVLLFQRWDVYAPNSKQYLEGLRYGHGTAMIHDWICPFMLVQVPFFDNLKPCESWSWSERFENTVWVSKTLRGRVAQGDDGNGEDIKCAHPPTNVKEKEKRKDSAAEKEQFAFTRRHINTTLDLTRGQHTHLESILTVIEKLKSSWTVLNRNLRLFHLDFPCSTFLPDNNNIFTTDGYGNFIDTEIYKLTLKATQLISAFTQLKSQVLELADDLSTHTSSLSPLTLYTDPDYMSSASPVVLREELMTRLDVTTRTVKELYDNAMVVGSLIHTLDTEELELTQEAAKSVVFSPPPPPSGQTVSFLTRLFNLLPFTAAPSSTLGESYKSTHLAAYNARKKELLGQAVHLCGGTWRELEWLENDVRDLIGAFGNVRDIFEGGREFRSGTCRARTQEKEIWNGEGKEKGSGGVWARAYNWYYRSEVTEAKGGEERWGLVREVAVKLGMYDVAARAFDERVRREKARRREGLEE